MMPYRSVDQKSKGLIRLRRVVAPCVLSRSLLALWLCLGTGSLPTLGKTCLSEGEVPVEEQETPQDMSAEQGATRLAALLAAPLPGLLRPATGKNAQPVARPAKMESGHLLANGLTAPLRC